jgi:lipid II:glycine glycyltransferase (peptidoglycan interpeptide bridge formation enzyme)
MESFTNTKAGVTKTRVTQDLRQSPKWAQYLNWVGWKSVRTSNGTANDSLNATSGSTPNHTPNSTSNGINIEIMVTKIGGLVKIQRPPALTADDLKEIDKICQDHKALFIKIEPSPEQDLKILQESGYVYSYSPLAPPSTIFIDLTLSEEELWKKISKTGRYTIRHAEAKTNFIKNPSLDDLQKFYEIALETAKKQKFTLQGFEDLKKKVEIFEEDAVLALGYDKNGTLIGGKFFLICEDSVWYLHAGTNETGRRSFAGHKMMWDSFLYFKSMGFKTMDMDGIDDPRFPNFTKTWGGFSFFKEKFGGDVVRFPYPQIKYVHPFFKFLNTFRTLPL